MARYKCAREGTYRIEFRRKTVKGHPQKKDHQSVCGHCLGSVLINVLLAHGKASVTIANSEQELGPCEVHVE
jgi:hypothetical protein